MDVGHARDVRTPAAARAFTVARVVCGAGVLATVLATPWGARLSACVVPNAAAAECGAGDAWYAAGCRRVMRAAKV